MSKLVNFVLIVRCQIGFDVGTSQFPLIRDKRKNFYDILNLSRDCKAEDIKKSYIELSKKYHPDKNVNKKFAHQKFLDICEAYSILSDPAKRRQYDDCLSLGTKWSNKSNNSYANTNNYGFSSSSYSSSSTSSHNRLLLKLALLPKSIIFAALVVIAVLNAGLEWKYIFNRYEGKKVILENRSIMASLMVNYAREQAKIHGNKEQMKRLQEGVLGQYDMTELLDLYMKDNLSESGNERD